ncbi:MAG: T9SS type A sorting domain-containing protein [Candidatus Kapabacteria bacterium]|nr:T9SS type A sorting domain-containing protein [Ignavibacteriota bacterium]MCW5884993.1 T9SS type A sorting domain-containing protein [Candidatus Kapabacteria bacterium]
MLKKIMYIFLVFSISIAGKLSADEIPFEFDGKSYKIVKTKQSWTEAAAYAISQGGHLVHIESREEQDAVYNAIVQNIETTYTVVMDGGGVAYVWIGATDIEEEGVWVWDGTNSGAGKVFWTGQGTAGSGNGATVDDSFINWGGIEQYGSPREPDNFNNMQDAAAIALEPWPKNMGILGKAGEWNDISTTNQLYFVIEFDNPSSINFDEKIELSSYSQPNPVKNNQTKIVFEAAGSETAYLKIYDLNGQLVKENSMQTIAGTNFFEIQFDNIAAGVLFYNVILKDYTHTGKLILE